ncbi:MAG: 8-amino-7-oxononanoate synthase [Sulfobacillus benefaciens]|uniref:8-amino-7-oxononanoate synthase n=1 Tax=Sulfobacillus benefaciens TaxID=453960 RepID=A0A2T2WRJ8_9FIRM|nr:MAG: 8-amino-7-oxononanoate synthase [Sulfobacillus benefaciens]
MNEKFSEDFSRWERDGRLREAVVADYGNAPLIEKNHNQYINVSSGNYMGMAQHPQVIKVAQQSLEQYGLSSGGSPLVCGYSTEQDVLTQRLAQFFETERALVVSSGYLAGLAVIPSLMEDGDTIFSDSLNHASLIDACRLSKARVVIYPHGDVNSLEERIKKDSSRRRMIVSDGIFSMDGDIAPLPQLLELAEQYRAWLLVDDSHAIGVLGQQGGGSWQYFDLHSPWIILASSLSKGLGIHGGVVAGSADVIQYLQNTARSWIFSSSLPPSWCAAGTTSLDILENSLPERQQLWHHSVYFRTHLQQMGHRTIATAAPEIPIIPWIIGPENDTLQVANHLRQGFIWASAIRPPSVPINSSRIRFALTANHTQEQIDYVLGVIQKLNLSFSPNKD